MRQDTRLERRGDLLVAALGACAAAVVAAVAALRATSHDKGTFLEWQPGYVLEHVKVFGVWLNLDVSGGQKDLLTSAMLLLVGVALFVAGRRLLLRGSDRLGARTFAEFAFFMVFLAADEALAVHETIGDNLGFLRGLPGIDHPDDAVFMSYGVVALLLAWRGRAILGSAGRAARALLAVAAVTGAAVVLTDLQVLGDEIWEENLEILTAGLLFAGLIALVAGRLREGIRPGDAASRRP